MFTFDLQATKVSYLLAKWISSLYEWSALQNVQSVSIDMFIILFCLCCMCPTSKYIIRTILSAFRCKFFIHTSWTLTRRNVFTLQRTKGVRMLGVNTSSNTFHFLLSKKIGIVFRSYKVCSVYTAVVPIVFVQRHTVHRYLWQ